MYLFTVYLVEEVGGRFTRLTSSLQKCYFYDEIPWGYLGQRGCGLWQIFRTCSTTPLINVCIRPFGLKWLLCVQVILIRGGLMGVYTAVLHMVR